MTNTIIRDFRQAEQIEEGYVYIEGLAIDPEDNTYRECKIVDLNKIELADNETFTFIAWGGGQRLNNVFKYSGGFYQIQRTGEKDLYFKTWKETVKYIQDSTDRSIGFEEAEILLPELAYTYL